MTLSTTGPISLANVNVELGLSSTATISLNQANVRTLAGIASGTISLSDLRGKSNAPTISISPGSLYTIISGGGSATSSSATATASGGAGGYTYALHVFLAIVIQLIVRLLHQLLLLLRFLMANSRAAYIVVL